MFLIVKSYQTMDDHFTAGLSVTSVRLKPANAEEQGVLAAGIVAKQTQAMQAL